MRNHESPSLKRKEYGDVVNIPNNLQNYVSALINPNSTYLIAASINLDSMGSFIY